MDSQAPTTRWPLGLIAILMFVLFFQGCQNQKIVLTAGPVVPYMAVIYDDKDPLKSQLDFVSVGRIALNLAVLLTALVVLPRHLPRWNDLVRSIRFQAAAILAAMLFNLVLFSGQVWVSLVFMPIGAICDWIDRIVGIPETWRPTTVGSVARLYFAMCWAAMFGVLCLTLWIAERYLDYDRRRWWQFNLRFLLAVTFAVGTGLGFILRWWPVEE
jgi:hypothetical protein